MLLTSDSGENDVALARMLVAELIDRFHVAAATCRTNSIENAGRCVVMGTRQNRVVMQALERLHLPDDDLHAEGYTLAVSEDLIVVAGDDEAGALYGLQSLLQLIASENGRVVAPGVMLRDWPHKPFRGLRLYLPGKENLPFFKRFMRDFVSFYKFNTLIIEMNAAMRLDRRPELNAGALEFAKCLNYTRRSRPEGPGRQFQDSAHHDTGDFALVDKEEVADIVRCARSLHIEVIPEIPSLTHAYYLLSRHRDLAEIREAEWPDTCCPLKSEVYEIYFDVLDEYIEVIQPKIVHIGHDEWRMPMDVCPDCRGKDYRELFAEDVRKIHAYVSDKGVRVAMWGDHLLETVRGAGARASDSVSGYKFRMPSGLTPDQVKTGIPKDILVLNWFWNTSSKPEAAGNEATLDEWGFEQVYGNFTPAILDQGYAERSQRKTLLGGAASAWSATNEFNIGKDQMDSFLGCASMLWSCEWPAWDDLDAALQPLIPVARRNLRGWSTPVEDGETVAPLDLSAGFNGDFPPDSPLRKVKPGQVTSGALTFQMPGPSAKSFAVVVGTSAELPADSPPQSQAVPVGVDASSLIFLHACDRPAGNHMGHFQIYNFEDTADLLGWYEVIYEDGFVITVPVRYGVNIMEWTWGRETHHGRVCYNADPVDCAEPGEAPLTFFAFEWVNPRFGKVIREVRLKATQGFVDAHDQPITPNALMLPALSLTRKRPAPESVTMEEDF